MDLDRLAAYRYELPEHLIAQAPMSDRSESRLMVVNRATGTFEHSRFSRIGDFLKANDSFVANNTKVIRARLLGERATGGKIEFLMLEPKHPTLWEGIMQSSAKQRPGLEFRVRCRDGSWLNGVITRGSNESPTGTVEVQFDRNPLACDAGELPLPPYIVRDGKLATHEDDRRYQTVYAKEEGSAAAPTAGLHFTPELIDALRARGHPWHEVTLHIGLGTFRPVKVDDLAQHEMHEERYSIDESTAHAINREKAEGRKIVAVGTTVVRTLESSALEGSGQVVPGVRRTRLFLRPGSARFQVVDRLVTNFHLPESTLLMLVCAFAGRELVLEAYREAVREEYRFFSYGDAMLIL